WYRPVSRDLHFWVLARLTHLSPLAFRLVAIVLWSIALTFYFALVARITTWPAAVFATLGVASLAMWGTVLLWISCSQDLWMLVFGLAALLLHARRRNSWAAL